MPWVLDETMIKLPLAERDTPSAMPRRQLPTRYLGLLLVLLLALGGCSATRLAYDRLDFFIQLYAADYIDLEAEQEAVWEPVLAAEHERHRAEELPYLAAYLEEMLVASQRGFDRENMSCLLGSLDALYRRQAGYGVNLAVPLLVALSSAQVQTLEARFRERTAEDLDEASAAVTPAGREKLARRYLETIEDWTGPLDPGQQAVVTAIVGRMPQSRQAFIAYRDQKRAELVKLLGARAGEAQLRAFLTAWLVEFQDLPPELAQARREMRARVTELFIELGQRLDTSQRRHLQDRLRDLRDDLMQLQRQPRMAALSC